MTVGLFGGTFDPPHAGHLQVALSAKKQFGLDEVWWIPAHSPPHKNTAGLSSYLHRLQMARIAAEMYPGMLASDIESSLRQPSYTIATVCELQRQHPECKFTLVMGEDSLAQFESWYQPRGHS